MNVTVIRSNRKTVAIQVNADLSVTMKVPLRATKKDIEKILKEKEPWILKHQADIARKKEEHGGGSIKMIANIIWLILFGIPMAIGYVVVGGLWCITIVGIPFGKQFFKLAKLALMPFGAKVV